MPAKQSLKFIGGVFAPDEAKEILLDLINHKLQFHSLKNFSAEERFGKPIASSVKRIAELKVIKEKVLSLTIQAKEDALHLKIDSTIDISFSKK